MLQTFIFTGFQGDYDKAGVYYMASVKEISKPLEFVFPYYGQLPSIITIFCAYTLPEYDVLA